MGMKPGVLGIAGAALAALCLSGCVPEIDEGAGDTPEPEATTESPASADPSASALEDVEAAIIDPSRSTWQRECAQQWADANANDYRAPDCYLTSVETDDLGLVPANPEPEDTPTKGTPAERAAAYRVLEEVASDPRETRGDRDCAADWIDAVYNGDPYAPTCGDVPGMSGDVFGLEENPYAN